MKQKNKNLKYTSKKDLASIAKEASIKDYAGMTRLELIESLSNLKQAPAVSPDTREKPPKTTSIINHIPSPSIPSPQPHEHESIADKYGVNRIVLMVRDPFWLYAYWEITPEHYAQVKSRINEQHSFDARISIKILDITDTDADSTNSFNYVQINSEARNWYIHVPKSDRIYSVEIGFLCSNGEFFRLAGSNSVRTPRAGMSNVFDERWMSTEDYDKLYVLSGGLGVGLSSMNLIEKKNDVHHREYFSGSGGSAHTNVPTAEKTAEFSYRNINTELIIYGTAAPGSLIQIGGIEKKVTPDGNFSIRFHLNTGEHPIPIQVKSPDGKKNQTYTIIVTKENG